ncbi:Hypothetical predicted protein, partial [Olea europaea subsp. europaea]
AAQNSDVITGILSISGTSIYVLIDFGATHSFISNICLVKINASCKKNDNVLEVSMPSGGIIDTNRIAMGVKINFDGLTLEADLYVIEMKDFDIILGMDWLGKNRAMIVYFEKEVIFQRSRKEEFRFCGLKVKAFPHVISVLKAKNMLRKPDCQGIEDLFDQLKSASVFSKIDLSPRIRCVTLSKYIPWRSLPRGLSQVIFSYERYNFEHFISLIEQYEEIEGCNPGEISTVDLQNVQKLREELCEINSLNESEIPDSLLQRLLEDGTTECSPVCVIIGGILGQVSAF